MVKKLNKFMLMAVAALALFSCAQEKDDSDRVVQERILNAFVDVNYPQARRTESGLVMIDSVEGTGDTLKLYKAGFFKYSIKSLGGIYSETNFEELAKVLGTYSNANYYGPKLYELGFQTTYAGVEEVMVNMREGGKATFILPPWLSYTTSKNSWNQNVSAIYEIELTEVVNNIITWEQDTMKAYANKYYPGLDTLSANFYFKKLHESGEDTLSNGSVNVWYIGRLLDGWVFDTNIADSAKKFGIFDKTKEYSALSVQYSESIDQMAEDNSLVEGFCRAIHQMNYGDKGFAMFNSDMGYGAEGSSSIGPYQPLTFWLYIEPDTK